MCKLLSVKDFRPFLQAMFPDVEDDSHDNHPYEHPMTAVGLVLMSAAAMGTTEATRLTIFTGYSRRFISAIMCNMQNNQLWVGGQYNTSSWLSPDGHIDPDRLWDHIEIACGNQWLPAADPTVAEEPCMVYWNEREGS